MVEYTTENTTDEKIFTQLRKLRAYQREQLSNQLYPKYVDDRNEVLDEVVTDLSISERIYNDLEYKYNQGSFFKYRRESMAKASREAYKKADEFRRELASLTRIYEASCKFNLKLKEFDIETEQMILAHLCEIQLICGNKKALPILEE